MSATFRPSRYRTQLTSMAFSPIPHFFYISDARQPQHNNSKASNAEFACFGGSHEQIEDAQITTGSALSLYPCIVRGSLSDGCPHPCRYCFDR